MSTRGGTSWGRRAATALVDSTSGPNLNFPGVARLVPKRKRLVGQLCFRLLGPPRIVISGTPAGPLRPSRPSGSVTRWKWPLTRYEPAKTPPASSAACPPSSHSQRLLTAASGLSDAAERSRRHAHCAGTKAPPPSWSERAVLFRALDSQPPLLPRCPLCPPVAPSQNPARLPLSLSKFPSPPFSIRPHPSFSITTNATLHRAPTSVFCSPEPLSRPRLGTFSLAQAIPNPDLWVPPSFFP